MKRKTTAGITSFSVPIKVFSTASTTGAGLTGLTSATSGLVAEYRRQGQSTWTAISLVGAPQKTLGSWTTGGFIADGSRGAYELDLPNVAMQAGARFVLVRLYGAANMLDVDIEIELDAVDYQTAAFGAMLAYTQPAGFLAATFPATVSSYAGGAVESVTSPVTVGTNNDKTGYTLSTAGVTGVTDGVWNALLSSYTVNGSFGARLIRSTNSNNEVSLTGGPTPHIAASIHNAEANSIPAGALTSAAIAEIQSGLATSANQTILIDGVGFITSVLMGSISDAGAAAETYQIAFGGATYTVDYSGLDATGNRSTTTRTKT